MKLIQQHAHGIPMARCKPQVVNAQAVMVYREICETESVQEQKSSVTNKTTIIFNFKLEKNQTWSSTVAFFPGDVVPALGQWVRAVVVLNQWGSYDIVVTHLLTEKKKLTSKQS